MDIVVYLALAVLAAVFLFSLFVLLLMCHRRYEYNRLLVAQSLRFSKLKHDHDRPEDTVQLGSHLSHVLSNNKWVEEVSGILADCLGVLKLCHLLSDKLSHVPLQQISPQMNELICHATTRVVPHFDSLLRSMAAKQVDIRVLEARAGALVAACWSLCTPFYLINAKYRGTLCPLVNQMEIHHARLRSALEQAEREKGESPLDAAVAEMEGEDGQCTSDTHPSSLPSTSQEESSSTTIVQSLATSRVNGALLMKESGGESKNRTESVRISVDDGETSSLLPSQQPASTTETGATGSHDAPAAAASDGGASAKSADPEEGGIKRR